jgi:hypothetical protein
MVALAAGALVSVSPASAQNTGCFLQGTYVFITVINSPSPAHDLGTFIFTPPPCQTPGLPGTVVIKSNRVEVAGIYFVNGTELLISVEGIVVTGLLAQFLDGLATSFVYTGVGSGAIFGGTALRQNLE